MVKSKMPRVVISALFLWASSGILAVAHSGDQTGSPPADTSSIGNSGLRTRGPQYRVSASDVLELDFPLVPEFNQVVTVRPDGYITLKDVGDVSVDGLTTPKLVETIKQSYSHVLRDPIVTVNLKDFQKPYFVVSGKVIRPGKYDMRGDVTALQAVAMAGGFDDEAKHSQVLLFRRGANDGYDIKTINAKLILQTGALQEDIHLQPGDMIFVPKSRLAKIKPWIPNSSLGLFMNNF